VGLFDRIRGRRDPARCARLDAAVAAVDRELAANLELSSMFDQTHQAVVFENSEFARHGGTLRAELAAAHASVADVYERMPATETAMERRGPANSIRPEDRALIEAWEGDVRAAQRAMRDEAAAPPPSVWASALARLRGSRRTGR
jgi:hypothetical protein